MTATDTNTNTNAAPPLMGETACMSELWEWSDFLGIPAHAILRAAHQLVGRHGEDAGEAHQH